MTARFAGSQELGQRRRRRLAQEAAGSIAALGSGRASRSSATPVVVPVPNGVSTGPQLPRETMIPGSWIAISALGVLGFAAWGFVVWLGLSAWSEQAGLSELVSLKSGPVPRFFSTVSLLLTAQLSLLIYWHRSRSRKDFLGRYRIWAWAGSFWGILCLCNATRFHLPLVRSLFARWPMNCWRGESLYWFVPLSIGILALHRLVAQDIYHSKPSRISWNLTFCFGLLVGAFHFGLELLLPDSWRVPVIAGTTMFWHYLLALTCLIHARYVTHVTNEALGKCPSFTVQIGRRLAAPLNWLGERLLNLWSSTRKQPELPIEKDSETESGKQQRTKKSASKSSVKTPVSKKPAKVNDEVTQSEELRDEPQEARTSWVGRLFAKRRRVGVDSSSHAQNSESPEPVTKPGKKSRRQQKATTATVKQEPQQTVQEEAIQNSEPESSQRPSLAETLRKRVFGRWILRTDAEHSSEDASQATSKGKRKQKSGVVPEPHTKSEPRSKTVKKMPASDKTPSGKSSGKEGGEEGEDRSHSPKRMSNRERKRLKKLQRQQQR